MATIDGGSGNDTLNGTNGADSISGGAGDDSISAGGGNDTVSGGSGSDTISGGSKSAPSYTEVGNGDEVTGTTGQDYFRWAAESASNATITLDDDTGGHNSGDGAADYVLVATTNSTNTLSLRGFDFGTDKVVLQEAYESITYGGTDHGGGYYSAYATVTYANGNTQSFNFELNGAGPFFPENVFITTEPLASDNDSLSGGSDADTFIVEDDFGDDTIDGGENGTDDDTIDLSGLSGPVTVSYTGDEAGTIVDGDDTITFTGIERLILTDHDDTVDASADSLGVDIQGGAGSDSILGGLGADTIDGGNEQDTIDGGDGDDSILGGWESDTILGGAGADYIEGNHHADSIDGGAGNDTILGGMDFDVLYGGDDDDLIYADGEGNSLASDTLYGGSGNDTLFVAERSGGADGSALYGEDGEDCLVGGDASETLDGGADDDLLDSGAGDDTLTGGLGNDTFSFDAGDGTDRITDFDLGDEDTDGFTNDQFDVSGLSGGTGPGGSVTAYDVTVNTDDLGNAVLLFPGGETVVLEGVAPSQIDSPSQMYAAGIPCYTPGTRIETASGPKLVEHLRPGDMVRTLDRGFQPVRWVGSRTLDRAALAAHPNLRPVVIRKGALGNARRMLVSPQHGFLIDGRLVRAKHLAETRGGKVARVDRKAETVTYVHFLCDRHEIVFAEGIATESLYPGPTALRTLDLPALGELLARFPHLSGGLADRAVAEATYGPPARSYVRGGELRRMKQHAARSKVSRPNAVAMM